MTDKIISTKIAFFDCQGLCNENDTGLTNVAANPAQLQDIMAIVFGIIGAVALVFVIIGGINFITSQGNPDAVSKARQTIIYAIIGLLAAISAEAIIIFVIGSL